MNKLFFGLCLFLVACESATKTDNNTKADMKLVGTVERLDPELDSIIKQDAQAEILATGFDWSEGPVWVAEHNMLLFSDIPPNKIFKWTEAKGLELFVTPSGYTDSAKRGGEVGSNGLVISPLDGKLVMCQHGDRRIAYMNAPMVAPAPNYVTVADKYQGKRFNSPNDLVFRSNGDIFFTDPPYGLEKNMDDPHKEIPFQGVYKVNQKGEVTLLIDSITRPNGIGFLQGEKTLIVANSDPQKAIWYLYDIGPNDTLTSAGVLYDATEAGKTAKGSPDGLKVSRRGIIFATGPGGIWIFSPQRKLVGKIKIPDPCSNVALSDDEKTLYITNDGNLLRVKLQ